MPDACTARREVYFQSSPSPFLTALHSPASSSYTNTCYSPGQRRWLTSGYNRMTGSVSNRLMVKSSISTPQQTKPLGSLRRLHPSLGQTLRHRCKIWSLPRPTRVYMAKPPHKPRRTTPPIHKIPLLQMQASMFPLLTTLRMLLLPLPTLSMLHLLLRTLTTLLLPQHLKATDLLPPHLLAAPTHNNVSPMDKTAHGLPPPCGRC
jgi:hypothetical protein